MITPVIAVSGEVGGCRFEIALQALIFEQDAVLQRLMPALELALRLRMIWRIANVFEIEVREVGLAKLARLGRHVLNASAALISQNAGLVVRSVAFKSL